MKKQKIKTVTFEEYDKQMSKIIAKHNSVADALIEMLNYSGRIKLKPFLISKHKLSKLKKRGGKK